LEKREDLAPVGEGGAGLVVVLEAAAPEREEQFAVVAQVSGVARALGSAEEFLQSSITRSALPGVRPLRSSMSA